jgi:type IV secretory pathway VirB4 component
MEILNSKKITKSSSSSTSQQFVDVAEIKDDTIVLKNGTLRGVLNVSAINYDLKSTQEQEAIIDQYKNFLNSLDFPIQILINSRKINIEKYLEFIERKEKDQPSELLRFQISEYKNFIKHLVSVSNIMDKNFYIIIPFSSIENREKGIFDSFSSLLNPRKSIMDKRELFETCRNQLFQRMDHIMAGLSGIGIKMVPLKTNELIELLYNSYNSNVFNLTELEDTHNLDLK